MEKIIKVIVLMNQQLLITEIEEVGADIELETFENADHTEGMLTETERYAETLASFFKNSLSD